MVLCFSEMNTTLVKLIISEIMKVDEGALQSSPIVCLPSISVVPTQPKNGNIWKHVDISI